MNDIPLDEKIALGQALNLAVNMLLATKKEGADFPSDEDIIGLTLHRTLPLIQKLKARYCEARDKPTMELKVWGIKNGRIWWYEL